MSGDFADDLRVSIATAQLAQQMYKAHCEAFSIPRLRWFQLPQHVRRGFEVVAARFLKGLRPTPAGLTAALNEMVSRVLPFEPRPGDPQ